MVQPRSKRVKDLFQTPIVRKLENLSAEGSRSGAVPLVCGSSVRWVIPMTPLLASVLIHLLNMYDATSNVIVQLISMSFVYI